MGRRHDGLRISALVWVTAAMALVIGLSVAFASATGKVPFNPWGGLTDQQKQAQVDAVHAANVKYLEDFEARHGDPRSLPVIKLSTYQPPAASVGAATAQARLIVHGRVSSVHFIADPTGNLPQMSANVTISEVGKGSLASGQIVVRQIGGPVAQPHGAGALIELEYEQLMLPGDEVLLLVTPMPDGGQYRAVYGPGVQFIRGGSLAGESSARYGIDGKPYSEIWKALTDPSLPTSSYPLRDQSQ